MTDVRYVRAGMENVVDLKLEVLSGMESSVVDYVPD
jgi:hypothetical protein